MNAQRRAPVWQRPTFYVLAALVAVIVLVGLFFPMITSWISVSFPGIPIAAQATHTPTRTLTTTSTPAIPFTATARRTVASPTLDPASASLLTAEAATETDSALETRREASKTPTRTATPTQPANLVYKKQLFEQGITGMDWYVPWESVNIGEVIASVAGVDRLRIIAPETGHLKWDYYQTGRKLFPLIIEQRVSMMAW